MKKSFLRNFICATTVVVATLMSTSLVTNAAISSSSFDTGVGIDKWPSQVNSPYVDMVSWVSKDGYFVGTGGGPANLKKLSTESNTKFFNLGFIQSTGTVTNGKVKWGWGGYNVLSEGSNDSQYLNLKQSIRDLRASGGDVSISFGGLNGVALWQTTQDVDVLYNTYLDIVQGYDLTRIDLDVEGGAQNKDYNIANAKAIKKLQDTTKVEVSLTLPVLPDGLTGTQLNVLEAYLANGVDLKLTNIMAMCYGSGTLNPGENYGTASLRAMDSTKDQLKDYYKKFANTTLTDNDAYSKLGVTVSVGYEGAGDPIFTPDWSKLVVEHSKSKNIAMTSFWSLNRDALLDGNKGITSQYEHSKIFSTFGSTVVGPNDNYAPTINGVSDKSINLGEKFDALAGITASDKEDGDLTNKIVVTGMVDSSKVGTYTIKYSVTDSKGVTTNASSIVKVVDPTLPQVPVYDATKTYLVGDQVLYNGVVYKAKYWTTNEAPGASQWGPWEKVN